MNKPITNLREALGQLGQSVRRQQRIERFRPLVQDYINTFGVEPSDAMLDMWAINSQGSMLDINAMDPLDPVHRHGLRDLDREEATRDDDAHEVFVSGVSKMVSDD